MKQKLASHNIQNMLDILHVFFGTIWQKFCICHCEYFYGFKRNKDALSSCNPCSASRWPIVNGDSTYNAKVNRTEFPYLDRIRLINLSHLFSSKFPIFLSRFRNLKAYMLSLGNIETAPLTPHRLEGKDWIDALALYMPPLRCPTDPALLLLRTRGYGVTAPRRRRIRKRFDRDVARHYYEAVVTRTSNNKPASHGRQAPFSGGFGVI